MDARSLTYNLDGAWRIGKGQAACPVCQPERRKDQDALSIGESNGKILLYRFKRRCSFVDIANASAMPLDAVQVDFEAQKEVDEKQKAYESTMLKKARLLWESTANIQGTKAETYLRSRGITVPLPPTLRFIPHIYHAPTASWGCAMVGFVHPTGGVHRTYLTKEGKKVPKNAKLMLGPCAGGSVKLSQGVGPVVVTEGIETGLSVLQGLTTPSPTVLAALSTSGMKSLILSPTAGTLSIFRDGDEAGEEAAKILASRATNLGWRVAITAPKEGKDWNDILIEGIAL